MSIPETQLETWSNQGAVSSSKRTHESIRKALSSHEWPEGMARTAYLQGSYANATNIYGNSDVDLVVETDSVFYSNLSEAEKLELNISKGSFTWSEFRTEVINALVEYYDAAAVDTSSENSLKLAAGSNRLAADIVPAVVYRRYREMELVAKGMTFWTRSGRQVINFPKLHIKFGSEKNAVEHTDGWFKPMVRVFKNARERVVQEDVSLEGAYPSYFVECLIYNAPDSTFGGTYAESYAEIVRWLMEALEADDPEFVCVNRHQWLFGNSSVQWELSSARDFVSRLADLWDNW